MRLGWLGKKKKKGTLSAGVDKDAQKDKNV